MSSPRRRRDEGTLGGPAGGQEEGDLELSPLSGGMTTDEGGAGEGEGDGPSPGSSSPRRQQQRPPRAAAPPARGHQRSASHGGTALLLRQPTASVSSAAADEVVDEAEEDDDRSTPSQDPLPNFQLVRILRCTLVRNLIILQRLRKFLYWRLGDYQVRSFA